MRLVDLFCGGGGFSLGAHKAGFDVSVAFDIDPILTSSYAINFPKTKFVLQDVSKLNANEIKKHAGGEIDGIFGGPPCQGFSSIGKRDPSDIRRSLLQHFFRLVSETKPKFFVMENVRGLAYTNSKPELEKALSLVRDQYDILGPVVWDASQFGAATKRSRIFIIGMHKDIGSPFTTENFDIWKHSPTTVWDALSDFENATFLEEDEAGFDKWKIKSNKKISSYAKRMRHPKGFFTGHKPTVHTDKILKRFKTIPQGGVDKIGRHPRLAWDGLCPTLRAGTGPDKGSHQAVRPIHPQHDRVITVREAARLQGFPDAHIFHPTIWHSFRMIGNSVSPIIAEAIFRAIHAKLSFVEKLQQSDLYAAE